MEMTHVPGEHKADIKLYALSTCPWCRKVKALLDELGVEYDFVDVDLLDDDEREKVVEEVRHWNPTGGFPTIVFDDEKCVVGFDEARIKETVGA